MPTVHMLHDVQPTVLTLCKQGANRQRIFLKKEQADEDLHVLPGGGGLIRKAEGESWSYFYCVVAEPGMREDPGVGDGQGSGIEDQWRDEDEIRKAAHFFAKSDRLITGLHDTVEPYGALVENAVALADFEVMDPMGVKQTIRKGSWYVGIEPSEAGRKAIDAGEFTGISLEGTGLREPVELAKASEEEKQSIWRKLGEALGVPLREDTGRLNDDTSREETVTVDTTKQDEALAGEVAEIKKQTGAATVAITELSGIVKGLVERFEMKEKKEKEEEKEPTPADLKKSIDELAKHRRLQAGRVRRRHRQAGRPGLQAGRQPRHAQEEVRLGLRAERNPLRRPR